LIVRDFTFEHASQINDLTYVPTGKSFVETSAALEETWHVGYFAYIPTVDSTMLEDCFGSDVLEQRDSITQLSSILEDSAASATTCTASIVSPAWIARLKSTAINLYRRRKFERKASRVRKQKK
jgi:hypothetical protein